MLVRAKIIIQAGKKVWNCDNGKCTEWTCNKSQWWYKLKKKVLKGNSIVHCKISITEQIFAAVRLLHNQE